MIKTVGRPLVALLAMAVASSWLYDWRAFALFPCISSSHSRTSVTAAAPAAAHSSYFDCLVERPRRVQRRPPARPIATHL